MTNGAVLKELQSISDEDLSAHRTELIGMIRDLIDEKKKVVDLSSP